MVAEHRTPAPLQEATPVTPVAANLLGFGQMSAGTQDLPDQLGRTPAAFRRAGQDFLSQDLDGALIGRGRREFLSLRINA